MGADWRKELEHWLSPFVGALGHKARARICPVYVAGLIGAGDRKSIQPMAARDGEAGYDQLHHFITNGVWNTVPLEKALLAEADRMLGGADAWLIVDDTALPKKGEHSVGVAPQYASSLGKTANCQSLVSLTLASREVPVMVGLRLFLPESWTGHPERMARARVPEDRQPPLTKPEIALEEIDRVIASGLRFGCVLADSGYGSSGPFRQALSERGLLWAVGLSRRQNVYPAEVDLIFPVAKAGRPRKYSIPDQLPVSVEALLTQGKWQRVNWRRGTKGRLTCRFAARRVRVADGHKHRMFDNKTQCMPGDEVWIGGNGQGASNASDETVTLTNGGAIYLSDNSRADVTGSSVTATLGVNDAFGLYGSNDTITLGSNDSVWLNPGAGVDELLFSGNTGTTTVSSFASGDIIDLLGGTGGYASASAGFSAIGSDGYGGSLLSLGANGSIDIVGVAASSLSAANFKIG